MAQGTIRGRQVAVERTVRAVHGLTVDFPDPARDVDGEGAVCVVNGEFVEDGVVLDASVEERFPLCAVCFFVAAHLALSFFDFGFGFGGAPHVASAERGDGVLPCSSGFPGVLLVNVWDLEFA